MMNCRVCDSLTSPQARLFDDRYGYPGEHVLLRCEACGQRALDVHLTEQQLSDLYTNYYPRSTLDVESWSPPTETQRLYSWWRGLESSAYRWVPRNVRVLDIGCGFGESLGYHRSRGCDAHGVETDRNILRVAERYGLNVQVGLFDSSKYAPDSFDVVTLDQVVEHIADPVAVIEGIRCVLRPGGMLVISTPNASGWGARLFGRRWVHWHAPYHVQFFSPRSMARAAKRAGMTVERQVTVTNSTWLHFQWGHLVTFPNQGERSSYWSVGQRPTVPQRVGLKVAHYANRVGINALITRFFDAVGLGDNIVYVLRKPG